MITAQTPGQLSSGDSGSQALHGVERNTMDIDISVVMSPENLQQLIAAAKDLQLTPMPPVPLEALADLDTLRQWHTQRNLQAFTLRSHALY